MASSKAKQIVIAAMDKFFAYRTVKDARETVDEDSAHRITATIEVEGIVTRGAGKHSSASPSALFEAMVVEMARRLDAAELRQCRKAAVKHAVEASARGTRPATMLSKRDKDAQCLIAGLKQDAAEKLPTTYSAGSIRFDGEPTITHATARKA